MEKGFACNGLRHLFKTRVGRRSDIEWVVIEHIADEHGIIRNAVIRSGVHDGEIQLTAEQTALNLVGRFLADANLNAGVFPVKRGQDARQMRCRQVVGDAYGVTRPCDSVLSSTISDSNDA